MASKKVRRDLTTFLIIVVIVAIAVPLIVFSADSGSSGSGSGGCGGCGGGCCGGSDVMEDTQGDSSEAGEEGAGAPTTPKTPTICVTRGLGSTKVDLGLTMTNFSNHYEYTYTYSIIACKEDVSYTITLEGDRFYTADAARIAKNGSVEKSGEYSSLQVPNFERDYNLFVKICAQTTDTSIGTSGKVCADRK